MDMNKTKITALSLCACLLLAGCNSFKSMNNTAKGGIIGGGSGATAGAIIGGLIGKGKGAGIGAAIGAAEKAAAAAQIEEAQVEQVTDNNGLPAVKVTFGDNVLFDFNSTALSNEAKASLRQLAEILREDTTTDIAIIGHTDKAGTYEVNLKFSKERAYNVENYLQDCGVSPKQFKEVKGVAYDEYDETKTAAENRRVEVYMYASEEMIQEAEAQS